MPASASAQTWPWAKRFGGYYRHGIQGIFGTLINGQLVKDVTCDNSGNVYTLSVNHDSLLSVDGVPLQGWGYLDNVISSFDCAGRYRWSKVIGSNTDSEFTCAIRTDYAGNLYACGRISLAQGGHFSTDTAPGPNPKTIFLAKWDSAGRFQWLRMPQPDTISHAVAVQTGSAIDMDIDDLGNVHLLCYLGPGLYGGSYVKSSAGAAVLRYSGAGQLLGGVALPLQLTAGGTMDEFLVSAYGFTYSPKLGQYLLAATSRTYDVSQPYPYPGVVQIGGQLIGSQVMGRGFFAAFNANTGSMLRLLTRPPAAPASDWGAVLQGRPAVDAGGSVFLAGYARDNSVFNGYLFHNPGKTQATNIPFVMKLDGQTGAVRWAQAGQSTGTFVYNQAYGATYSQLALSTGKVLMCGRFADSLIFPGATLARLSAGDSIRGFVLQLDAATGGVQRAEAFGSGNYLNQTYPAAVAADKRGNFYISGAYSSPSLTFGGTTLQNPLIYSHDNDLFLAKWGIASCSCTVPSPVYTSGAVSGATRRFTYTGTVAGIDSLVWSWGDGQSQRVSTGFTAAISHTYASAGGSYEVCVTAYSSSCGSNQSCGQSSPLGVGGGAGSGGARVYPNPAKGIITIADAAGSRMTLRSVVGAVVAEGSIATAQAPVDISALPGGVYVLSLRGADGTVTSLRIVKE